MTSKQQDLVIINIATIILAFSGLFAKLITLSASEIIAGRCLIAALSLTLMGAVVKQRWRVASKDIWRLGWVSILFTGHLVFFYMAIQVSTLAIGIISMFTFPFMTALLEPYFFKSTLKKGQVGIGGLIIVGVYLVTQQPPEMGHVMLGVAYGLVSALWLKTWLVNRNLLP